MLETVESKDYHLSKESWIRTSEGKPRGYIQPQRLTELWFHTGTACNLSCPFCLEGSRPGYHRLQQVTFEDVRPFIDEGVNLGVEQFSFTGGEPFINKDFVQILAYALDRRPCLVLTNGTKPIRRRIEAVRTLLNQANPVRFRISFDVPDAQKHDANRGAGSFNLALETLRDLHRQGFGVSIARQSTPDEDAIAIEESYRSYFHQAGVPKDTTIVAFPDFLTPGTHPDGIPELTEHCMTMYHTDESRRAFMCNFSKMIVKTQGRIRVYACTLVDDDKDYDLGGTLTDAMRARIMLRHHRCFSCFQYGATCSEHC